MTSTHRSGSIATSGGAMPASRPSRSWRGRSGDAWVEALAGGRDLAADAAAYLGRSGDGLAARMGRMTPMELGLFLDSSGSGGDDTSAACSSRGATWSSGSWPTTWSVTSKTSCP